jgi:predicted Rossmann fold flavoprotein
VTNPSIDVDTVIVGAGAAGLATAIFILQRRPSARLEVLDGARRPGAKILVSGGSRCNVTNAVVTESDFNGGRPAVIRTILRALPVAETVAFFHGIGAPLHEEPNGKLFPDSNRSRDVLEALLNELTRLGSAVSADHRVLDVAPDGPGFSVTTSKGTIRARTVVLATGGLSLPKTGSDGAGYQFARRFGHSIVPTTPALAPMVLATGSAPMHTALSGVTQMVRLDLRVDAAIAARISGSMLWTHFGVSGPVVLDMSRHWLRARLNGLAPELRVSLCPDHTFESLEALWLDLARRQPRISIQTALSTILPASLGAAVIETADLSPAQTLADLGRADRRHIVHALIELPLSVTDSRGYAYAEATAGGVDLSESIRRPWNRGGAPASTWWGRCSTSTAASAASTSSGRGRRRGWRRARWHASPHRQHQRWGCELTLERSGSLDIPRLTWETTPGRSPHATRPCRRSARPRRPP